MKKLNIYEQKNYNKRLTEVLVENKNLNEKVKTLESEMETLKMLNNFLTETARLYDVLRDEHEKLKEKFGN